MSKRKSVSKLFAVALGVAGCEEAPAVTSPAPSAKPAQTVGVAKPAPVTPRTLASGRPACGNVMGKAPMSPECEAVANRSPDDWKKYCFVVASAGCLAGSDIDNEVWNQLPAITQAQIRTAATPRTLRDGAPAPGNVASRAVKR